MSGQKTTLKVLLKRLKREATGYLLAYDPCGDTHYACRAWLGDKTGPWFHSHGMTLKEVIEDCLIQIEAFKHGKEKAETEED